MDDHRFRRLAESSELVFWFSCLKPERVEYVSRAFETIWGIPADELYRDPRRWLGAVHPEDRERVEAAFERWLRGEGAFDIEYQIVRADGQLRWIHDRGVAHASLPDGGLEFSGIACDITQRKRSEVALRESQERFNLLASSTFEGISVIHNGVICEVNQQLASMFGYSVEEMVGHSMFEFVAPEEHARLTKRVEESDVSPTEFIGKRRDGSTFPMEVRSRLLKSGGRSLRVSALRDASDRHRTEKALRDVDRRKNDFLAALSHELRNPLMPIRSGLSVLERVPGDSDFAVRSRAIVNRQVAHLARIVDDLLDVTRITRGKIELKLERLDLVGVAARTIEDHRAAFSAAGVELKTDLTSEPLWVDGDPTRVAQILGNLLSNAAKFTPSGGRVEVEVQREGSAAAIRVRDTGIGISREMLAHLFEPFTQAQQPPDRRQGGLGLGLSLVKGLVEEHGGKIFATSDGEGKGAEFTVSLPVAVAPKATMHGEAACQPARGRRVLVIEDNRDAAESLHDLLKLSGHDVRTAPDGPTGLAEARGFLPEILFCDIGLPGMTGYEVARAFRADEALKKTRLVALTGYTLPEDKERAREVGFEDFLAKPAEPEEIERFVDSLPRRFDGR